jgi:hypothetical protein
MATLRAPTAEKHLAHQLRVQMSVMERRGIAPDLIIAQINALETAVRCELCRQLVLQGGAA